MWIFNSLIIAIAMYSKIPMPQAEWNEKNMRYAMCFFPVVGVVIGAAEFAAGYALLHWLHCKPLLFSVAMTLIPVLITGGIHLDGFAAHVIHHTPRRTDDNLHTILEGTDLTSDLLSAVDREDLDPGHVFRKAAKLFRYLDRKFSRRAEDHCLCLSVFRVHLHEKRNSKSCGLTGSGLRLADHVMAFHLNRDRLGLDRGRRLKSHICNCAEDPRV